MNGKLHFVYCRIQNILIFSLLKVEIEKSKWFIAIKIFCSTVYVTAKTSLKTQYWKKGNMPTKNQWWSTVVIHLLINFSSMSHSHSNSDSVVISYKLHINKCINQPKMCGNVNHDTYS